VGIIRLYDSGSIRVIITASGFSPSDAELINLYFIGTKAKKIICISSAWAECLPKPLTEELKNEIT